jgi:hypothetical protein
MQHLAKYNNIILTHFSYLAFATVFFFESIPGNFVPTYDFL